MVRMEEWPAWQRWGVWLCGWALYGGAFWLLFQFAGIAVRVVALAGICAGLLLLTHASAAVLNERMRKADRGYLRMVLPAFLAYIVIVLYLWPLGQHVASPVAKFALALTPVLPLVLVVWSMGRYINRCDELERRQHIEAIAIAAGAVGLVAMAFGFLAAAKLLAVDGALVLILVFPALAVVYGVVCGWSKWRNRAR